MTWDPAPGLTSERFKRKTKCDDSVFQRKLKKKKNEKESKKLQPPKYAEAEEMGPVEGQEEAPSALHIPVGMQGWISRVSSARGVVREGNTARIGPTFCLRWKS